MRHLRLFVVLAAAFAVSVFGFITAPAQADQGAAVASAHAAARPTADKATPKITAKIVM